MPRRRSQRFQTSEYDEGFDDGYAEGMIEGMLRMDRPKRATRRRSPVKRGTKPRSGRKLSAWQKFMKSPKSQIKIKRGKDKGKLNLKAMGKAYRKQQRGKK